MDTPPPIPSHWTEAERWAWEELVAGHAADFDKRSGQSLDPANAAPWTAERTLSAEFIKDIFKEPFASRLTAGTAIRGARVSGSVNAGAPCPGPLSLKSCRIEDHVFLPASIGGRLELESIWVGGTIFGVNTHVAGSVSFRELTARSIAFHRAAVAGDVVFMPAMVDAADRVELKASAGRIEESISINDASVEGDVHLSHVSAGGVSLDGTKVGRSVHVSDLHLTDGASFERVDVAGQLAVYASEFESINADRSVIGRDFQCHATTKTLRMSGARIGGAFVVSGKVDEFLTVEGTQVGLDISFQRVTLSGANFLDLRGMHCGGSLVFDGALCNQAIWMDRVEVIGDLVFKGGSSVKPGVRAPLITVGGSVRLEKVDAGDIDFAGAEITRDLQLMSLFGLRWTESASMVLRNAEVGALADWSFSGDDPAADPWPRKLDLRGFSFRKLVSFDNGPDRASFSPEMLQNWLERDISRSVQPYVQLASVLQKAGEIGRANRVLYAGRELARRRAGETRQRARWLGLSLLKWTIGYGIGARYFTALIWVAVFTAIGVATLQLDQMWSHHQIAAGSTGVAWMTFASLDALLPVVTLDKAFSDNVPTNTHFLAAKIVFWTLSLAGWMLGSFLVAGLAGLTQKSS